MVGAMIGMCYGGGECLGIVQHPHPTYAVLLCVQNPKGDAVSICYDARGEGVGLRCGIHIWVIRFPSSISRNTLYTSITYITNGAIYKHIHMI